MRIEGLSYIYKITNPIGQIYIGQTKDWYDRLEHYRKLDCKNQKLIYNSVINFGWENHKIELLTLCQNKDIDTEEKKFIAENKSYCKLNPNGLNMTKGGKWTKGFTPENEIPIIQYTVEGEFVKVWKSTADAANFYKVSPSTILRCINKKKNYHCIAGFQWGKFKEDFEAPINPVNKQKNWMEVNPVILKNLKTGEQTVYKSFKEMCIKADIKNGTAYTAIIKRSGVMLRKGLKLIVIGEFAKNINLKDISKSKKIPITATDINGKVFNFDSAIDAIKELGLKKGSNANISEGIKNGGRKYEYYWKLTEEANKIRR